MNEKLKVLLMAVSEVTQIDIQVLRKKKADTHRIAYAKHIFCYVGFNKLKFRQQVIGDFIGLSQGRVCQVTDRGNFLRVNNQGNKEICKEVTKVEEKFEELSENLRLGKINL